jgi:hypothetical protein
VISCLVDGCGSVLRVAPADAFADLNRRHSDTGLTARRDVAVRVGIDEEWDSMLLSLITFLCCAEVSEGSRAQSTSTISLQPHCDRYDEAL